MVVDAGKADLADSGEGTLGSKHHEENGSHAGPDKQRCQDPTHDNAEEQDVEDTEGNRVPGPENSAGAKKKKKKKKPKQSEGQDGAGQAGNSGSLKNDAKKVDSKQGSGSRLPAVEGNVIPAQENSGLRLLGAWPEIHNTLQTVPPTVPISRIYPNGFPEGEMLDYPATFRPGRQELKELDQLANIDYDGIRQAAECHRQVRKYVQSYIKPGMKMIDIVQMLERKVDELIETEGLKRGRAFPTGCSLNECAAHYTPNPRDTRVLQQGDICKIDFGTHVNGFIVDSAFSIAFEPHFDGLINATKDGTNTGVRVAGVDALLSDVGAAIHEVIESYEVEINQKTYRIKPVENLTGHSILPYRIHGGKCVPIVRNNGTRDRMEEGEIFAVETFASTGRGHVIDSMDLECSHYAREPNSKFNSYGTRLKSAHELLKRIDKNFGTLPFCRRWLDDIDSSKSHLLALKGLVDNDIVQPYPPLSDIMGSYTSQTEHTIILHAGKKEVISRGPDY